MSAFVQKIALDFGESSLRLYTQTTGEYIEGTQEEFFSQFQRSQIKLLHTTKNTVSFEDAYSRTAIKDSTLLSAYLRFLLSRAGLGGFVFSRIELLMAVPTNESSTTKQVWLEVCERIGISKVTFVSSALAAAVGAGFSFPIPTVALLVHLGFTHSEVSAVSLNQCLFSWSLSCTLRSLRERIESVFLLQLGHALLPEEWEHIQSQFGSLLLETIDKKIGLLPDQSQKFEHQLTQIIREFGEDLVTDIEIAMERLSLEELSVCSAQGIVVTGGLAKQEGIARYLSKQLAIPVYSSTEPDMAIIRGEAVLLKSIEEEKMR